MGVGAGLYVYVVVVQKFTFAISSPDEFLLKFLYKDQTRKYDPKAKAHEKHPIHGTPFSFSWITSCKTTSISLIYLVIKSNFIHDWKATVVFVLNMRFIYYVCVLRARVQPTLDHTLRPFCSRPIALTQEGRSLVNDVCECVRDLRVRRGE